MFLETVTKSVFAAVVGVLRWGWGWVRHFFWAMSNGFYGFGYDKICVGVKTDN